MKNEHCNYLDDFCDYEGIIPCLVRLLILCGGNRFSKIKRGKIANHKSYHRTKGANPKGNYRGSEITPRTLA